MEILRASLNVSGFESAESSYTVRHGSWPNSVKDKPNSVSIGGLEGAEGCKGEETRKFTSLGEGPYGFSGFALTSVDEAAAKLE